MTTRVAIITQDDPFYMPLFFESLLSSKSDSIDIVSVTVLKPFDESFIDLVQRMYRLYGPLNVLQRGMEFVGRKAMDTIGFGTYSVESVAQPYDVPVVYRQSVNTGEFIEMVTSSDIDIVLSASAPEIFDPEVLTAPSWGCLNVHTAELPKYRGMLPTFWALYYGEDEIGVTVHTMAEEIDQGEIIRQTTFSVADGDTLDDVIRRGKYVGGELAAEALTDVDAGSVTRESMDGEGSYFSFPTMEERREFQRRGRELL